MRTLRFLVFGIFIAFSLASCMNISTEDSNSSVGYIKIAIASNARTVNYTSPYLYDFSSFTLEGVQVADNTKTVYKSYSSSSSLSNSLEIETGEWNFTLTGMKGYSVYYTGTTSATIEGGETVALTFALEYDESKSSGYGSLTVQLNIPSYTAQVAKGGLYSIEDDTAVSGFSESSFGSPYYYSDVTYSASSVPAGTYRLKVNFYSDTAATVKIATYSEIVNIAAGLTSSATRDISFNDVYSIAYNLNGGSYASGETAVAQCSLYDNEITLPRLETRTGFSFAGWATSADGEKVYDDGETITVAEDMALYAKWDSVSVSASDLSSLDLSTLQEAYTLTIDGSVNSTSLQTIATKIKSATADITLDLSNTTIEGNTIGSNDSSSIFSSCSRLKSIVFPDTLETIGNYAFYNTSLTSVSFPSSVVTIGERAFSSCPLQTISFNGNKSIGNYAFYNCYSLVSVTIDAESIGAYAFSSCSNLTSVTISSNVSTITGYAFSSCSSLTSVKFDDTSSTWYYNKSSGTKYSLDVTNAATNATNLKSTSYSYSTDIYGLGYYTWTKE